MQAHIFGKRVGHTSREEGACLALLGVHVGTWALAASCAKGSDSDDGKKINHCLQSDYAGLV